MKLLQAIVKVLENFNQPPAAAKSLLDYLQYFGYVILTDDTAMADIMTAVKVFQERFGIREAGIGPKTLRALAAPRCMNKDFVTERASSPAKWGPSDLGYYIRGRDSDMSIEAWDGAIKRATDSITAVCNLRFHQVDRQSEANIILDVGSGRHDDFDGPSGTLAWHQLPTQTNYRGQLLGKFDISETWTADPSRRGIILENVACHEIIHGVGLYHSQRDSALMAPFYSAGISKPQQNDDIPRLQALYGPPVSQPKPDVPAPNQPGKFTIVIEADKITGVSVPGYRLVKMD